ncbi:MAG: hypothetical protein ACFCUG_14625 [Thiotrichales bacterium]
MIPKNTDERSPNDPRNRVYRPNRDSPRQGGSLTFDMEAIVIGVGSNIQDGGGVLIGRNTSIAHRSVVHGHCQVGDGSVVRHNSVVEGCTVPPGFYIPSTTNIHSNVELAKTTPVTPDQARVSERLAHANHKLVRGYKRLRNEF